MQHPSQPYMTASPAPIGSRPLSAHPRTTHAIPAMLRSPAARQQSPGRPSSDTRLCLLAGFWKASWTRRVGMKLLALPGAQCARTPRPTQRVPAGDSRHHPGDGAKDGTRSPCQIRVCGLLLGVPKSWLAGLDHAASDLPRWAFKAGPNPLPRMRQSLLPRDTRQSLLPSPRPSSTAHLSPCPTTATPRRRTPTPPTTPGRRTTLSRRT